jgi:adenosylmethionine-8-amino-7-oxononanoate aminotransferase
MTARLPDAERLDTELLWHPFTQMAAWAPLVIVEGDGNYLVDSEGHRYLDGVSSLWCNVHGNRHPRLDRALRAQLDRIAHSTFLGLTHEPAIQLAAALVDVAPRGLRRVFYSDSGATAVEIALKQSFQYWQLRGLGDKQRFLRLDEAYHGDTLGAVSVGGIALFHRIFGPLLVRSVAIPSPAGTDGSVALAALEQQLAAHAGQLAAFVVEPLIQGAAGMLVHPPAFLSRAAELCRRHSVHLIVDEVATGFGRTGTVFACEQEGVSPDFLCLAKGISGGYLPLAATLTTEDVYAAFLGKPEELKQFFHGHTYTAQRTRTHSRLRRGGRSRCSAARRGIGSPVWTHGRHRARRPSAAPPRQRGLRARSQPRRDPASARGRHRVDAAAHGRG